MWITKSISITNFMIASSALGFQVFVLYPWHKKLDEGFVNLRDEQIRSMQVYEGQRDEVLRDIKGALDDLRRERNERGGWLGRR